jgi:hypothetical protein
MSSLAVAIYKTRAQYHHVLSTTHTKGLLLPDTEKRRARASPLPSTLSIPAGLALRNQYRSKSTLQANFDRRHNPYSDPHRVMPEAVPPGGFQVRRLFRLKCYLGWHLADSGDFEDHVHDIELPHFSQNGFRQWTEAHQGVARCDKHGLDVWMRFGPEESTPERTLVRTWCTDAGERTIDDHEAPGDIYTQLKGLANAFRDEQRRRKRAAADA